MDYGPETTVSQLLGGQFVDLLSRLPDWFFRLDKSEQARIWRELRREVVEGRREIKHLVGVAVRLAGRVPV